MMRKSFQLLKQEYSKWLKFFMAPKHRNRQARGRPSDAYIEGKALRRMAEDSFKRGEIDRLEFKLATKFARQYPELYNVFRDKLFKEYDRSVPTKAIAW